MDVGPGCNSGFGFSKGDKRHPEAAEFAEQCAAFRAVRAQCDIDSVAMIESQTGMQTRLPKGAYGQSATKLGHKEALYVADHLAPRGRYDIGFFFGGRGSGSRSDFWRRLVFPSGDINWFPYLKRFSAQIPGGRS
jgi:hypothetical protein